MHINIVNVMTVEALKGEEEESCDPQSVAFRQAS